MYTVILGDETRKFESRKEAIQTAKDISDTSRGYVEVQDEKLKELFRYRGGNLELYLFETREGRTVRH